MMRWFQRYPQRFLTNYLEDPSELNFFAFMGPVTAALTGLDGNGREKDYRRYKDLPGWKLLLRFYRSTTRS